jgi:hypothetical protein
MTHGMHQYLFLVLLKDHMELSFSLFYLFQKLPQNLLVVNDDLDQALLKLEGLMGLA